MADPVVTADLLEQARRIVKILGRREDAETVRALARELTWLHDRAVACATVRVEREFMVRPRKKSAVTPPPNRT